MQKIDEIARRLAIEENGLLENFIKKDQLNKKSEKLSKINLMNSIVQQSKEENLTKFQTDVNSSVNKNANTNFSMPCESKVSNKCQKVHQSEIFINVNNDSKVEIKEEYDSLNRKVINIIVDDKANSINVNQKKLTNSANVIKDQKSISSSQFKQSTGKPYKSIEEYKKKIDEKLSKLRK